MSTHQALGGNAALQLIAQAREALERNDYGRALHCTSSALASDPTQREWRELLTRILDRCVDPQVFVRNDEARTDFVNASARASIFAWRGEFAEAIAIICEVAAVRPDCAYLTWAAEWVLERDARALITEELLARRVLPATLRAIAACPSPCPAEDPRRANCAAAIELLKALREHRPDDSQIMFCLGAALRRVGRVEEAIHHASRAFSLRNDWTTCIGLAGAYRDAGLIDEAIRHYRLAYSLKPEEAAPILDIGNTYLESRRYAEAIATYQEVLTELHPHDGWALASIAYARFRQSGAPDDQRRLWAMSETNPRARELFIRTVGDLPFFTWLPMPGDSMANAVLQLTGELDRNPPSPHGVSLELPLQTMDAPSALIAFRLWTEARNWNQVSLCPRVEYIPSPDPRQPRGDVQFVLWSFDGRTPRPNTPAPARRLVDAISTIARKPYSLPMWEIEARDLAGQIGLDWLNQLYCAMVHPPPLPAPDYDPINWVYRCQIATALVIGYLDDGWSRSSRRSALVSIAFGPVDWVVDAAIVVLGWLASSDIVIRDDVERIFGQLEKTISHNAYTCFEYALVSVWRNLGDHDPTMEVRLDEWKTRVEHQHIEFAEEKHGGLTLEQYAELVSLRDAILAKHRTDPSGFLRTGVHPQLVQLCARFGIAPLQTAAAARVPAWDERINSDGRLQERFFDLKARFDQRHATLR